MRTHAWPPRTLRTPRPFNDMHPGAPAGLSPAPLPLTRKRHLPYPCSLQTDPSQPEVFPPYLVPDLRSFHGLAQAAARLAPDESAPGRAVAECAQILMVRAGHRAASSLMP